MDLATTSSPATVQSRWSGAIQRLKTLPDRMIPPALLENPDVARRAGLMTRFGTLGALFGLSYALFYALIGHKWGAEIILVCTVGVMVSPLLMRWQGKIEPAANFFSFILTIGFLALCFVEGGAHGHALAWLVSVPLCALILAGMKPAIKWLVAAFLAASLVVGLDLAGVNLPVTYDPKWNSLVSAAGYLGLIMFMCLLGLIFESGRASAYAKMQEALAQLAASNERLTELNNEKTEFLGIAAHDLKNPLAVVLLNAGMLEKFGGQPMIKNLAEMIITASGRMHRLITNLLDVNAIEEGRFASRQDRCEMAKLVRESVENNRPMAQRKEIELRLGLSEEVEAQADRGAILQILDNLISNAIKYSPLNSTVNITLMPETEAVLVLVRDEGPGISEEDQKKLFQKFTRLSACPTGGESSNGLGLSIAKKLAEAMGGTIECRSTFGMGSTFVLRLPSWPGKAAAGTAPAANGAKDAPSETPRSGYARK